MKFFVSLVLLSILLFSKDSYKLGIFPHLPLKTLHMVYLPVSKDFEKYMDKPVKLMSKPYFKLYKKELLEGVYDIALIQPFDYIEAHEKQGYIPLARRAENLEAIMVVNTNADFKTIDDIKHSVIASAPSTAAVTIMLLHDLELKGYRVLDDFTISYSKNHFVCLQKVLNTKAAACVTAQRSLNMFTKDKGKNIFRIIYTSLSLPHVLYVAHPRVAKSQRDKLQAHLLNWEEESSVEHAKTKYIKAEDSDYDVVRDFIKIQD